MTIETCYCRGLACELSKDPWAVEWCGDIPRDVLTQVQEVADSSTLPQTILHSNDYLGGFWEHREASGYAWTWRTSADCLLDAQPILTLLPAGWWR